MHTVSMSISEVAEKLNISVDTIRRWEIKLNLNIPLDSRNRKKYSEEHFKLLQSIKELREQDNGLDTITRKLSIGYAVDKHTIGNDNAEPYAVGMQAISISDLKDLENSITSKLDIVDNLSEKLSRASFEIGKLTAEKTGLEEKMKLITDGNNKDLASLQKEIEKQRLGHESQLEKLTRENEKLKADLEKKNIPWYLKQYKLF